MSVEQVDWYWSAIKKILSILMILLLFTTIIVIISALIMPSASEYDDPNTQVNESFPWNPSIFNNSGRVLELFIAGFLRHISILPEHLNLFHIINFSSYVFFLIFIYGVKQELENKKKFQMHNYAEWGIAAIIGAIMSLVRTLDTRDINDVTAATVLLSISAVILYLVHPKNWVKSFLEKYLNRIKSQKNPENLEKDNGTS